MPIILHHHLEWLLTAPAAVIAWRARSTVKAPALFCAAAVLIWFAALGAAPTRATAVPPAQDSSHHALGMNTSFAIADLDGDRRPDLATAEIERSELRFTRYLIRLQFTATAEQSGQAIGVTGAFGLPQISAIDVNGDHALDLVVTAAGHKLPIAVLLNDGRGKFSLARPGDFPAAALDSPWRWVPANRHIPDIALLIPTRTPQADAQSAWRSFASRQLAESRFSTSRGFWPEPLLSSPLGRAPPRSA